MSRDYPLQLLVVILFGGFSLAATVPGTLTVSGLQQPVEILKDHWGISHIYAQGESDLFFAQGYNAARDRLFQLEIWRRRATGTVAEILGPRELKRDMGARLFKFRGDLTRELNHYHPRGEQIVRSFVRGINAYIDGTEQNPDLLPLEFEILHIKPGKWTPEVVVSRHQGLLGNLVRELNYGRAVARLGPDRIRELSNFHPGQPDLALDPAIEPDLLFEDILELYDAFRKRLRFESRELTPTSRAQSVAGEVAGSELEDIGSNNWVVSGALTQSRYPMMANDPHRAQSVPSLRYWVHLVGPGWQVIGGGEPAIPGVSIGHNGHGAWGLTVFRTDGEDLYVYDTHPDDPLQYRYQERWEEMRVLSETIAVKGRDPVSVSLKYTLHGPVVYQDLKHHKAYAVRAAWMEPGGAPYLASLRIDQAHNWQEFREACSYFNIPGENMVWADRAGDIGWQAVGIAPIRPNWTGLVPVPGDGRYEWGGYLPIKAKPHRHNPEQGFLATANADLIPPAYPFRNAVGWSWTDPFRQDRIEEVLASGRRHTLMDMIQLQTDSLSLPARNLVPLLRALHSPDPTAEKARKRLLDWDFVLDKDSAEAGVYVAWERRLRDKGEKLFIPETVRELLPRLSMQKLIQWLVAPGSAFGETPLAGRDDFLIRALEEAVAGLTRRFGADMSRWQYGRYKHILIRHPLSAIVEPQLKGKLNVGPLPRGGNSYTVGSTGWNDNQTSGASFRIIVDTSDWDQTVGMNSPGQSGDPDSPFYKDLFPLWALDKTFPVFYSREKVQAAASQLLFLKPEPEASR
ncbi:MAG: penicillin acylase family protein [Acidobacteriota bacterium]